MRGSTSPREAACDGAARRHRDRALGGVERSRRDRRVVRPVARDAPALVVHEQVMVPAQQNTVRDVGAAVFSMPGHDVVRLAPGGRSLAAGEPASAVARGEADALSGGEQALEQIRRRRFDVILADWKMPGLNGARLYDHLRATDPDAAARVLFMTGDMVNDTFQEFLRRHRLACLAKPFAAREFRAAVMKLLKALDA